MKIVRQLNSFILLIIFSIIFNCNNIAQSEHYLSPRDGWDFKFKEFVIGAWYGPYASDTEMQLYKDAGFNILMTGRYMNNDDKNLDENIVSDHLELAKKYNFSTIFDPYSFNTWSDTPVSTEAGPVSLSELEWIYDKFGNDPTLVGFLLGDDQSQISDQLRSTTNFMKENCPHLMPWICENHLNSSMLVELGNPIADWQMYPTLYNIDLSATGQMQIYCNQLNKLYEQCNQNDLIMWPMFNVVYVESDNIIRFQIYSSLAYASQGIWYFHYRGGLRGNGTDVLDTYYPAAEGNKRVASWGPLLLDRKSAGIYSTGWEIENSINPDSGKYVVEMSDNLLVGILEKENEYPLAMVVDKRVSKDWLLTPREVELSFSDRIKEIQILEGDSIVHSTLGNNIVLQIKAGGGQLLRLIDPTPKIISAKPSSSLSGTVELDVINNHDSLKYWIHYNTIGESIKDSVLVEKGSYVINNLSEDSLYIFRIKAEMADGNYSALSNSIISSTRSSKRQVLIVDGANNNFSPYHASLLHTMDYGIASCKSIAIENNSIDINNFEVIDFLVGNDDKNNITKILQEKIINYLENGGNLLISGSNIGSNLSSNGIKSDKIFFQSYLKSYYLFTAPDKIESQFYQLEPKPGTIFEGLPILQFDNGTQGTYDVYSPDVIAEWQGSIEGLRFANANRAYKGACNYYAGTFGESNISSKLVYLSVPVESIYPDESRKQLLDRIINFFNDTTATSVNLHTEQLPNIVELRQNYPNPFNPITTINYTIPVDVKYTNSSATKLIVYNVLGKKVAILVDENQNAGKYNVEFDASDIASGIYYYTLKTGKYQITKKMILLK